MEALERQARLDPNRLPRGRSYARSGAVGQLAIRPGEVLAPVQGSRATPYLVRLRVREFTEREWERVLATIASRAAHAAALLDGELDPAVAEDVDKAGTKLLPVAGELGPSCSCPDWANPCKHAAAVCYLVADRMDEDPFTILLLRGRSREQVLAGLRRLRAADAVRAAEILPSARTRGDTQAEADPGVEARTLFARGAAAVPLALPSPLSPPSHAGEPASLATDPPPGSGVAAEDLVALAADAARRALELCRGTGDGRLGLAPEADLARLAAERLGKPDFDGFAARAQVAPRVLMRLALTWAAGGAAALEVLNGAPWKPPPQEVEEGSAAFRRVSGGVTVRGERVSNGRAGVQLRYGRDGLWYLLVRRSGVWEIHDPPAADPEELMSLVPAQTAAIAPSPLVRSGGGGSVDHAPRHVAGGAGEVAGGRRRRARQARVTVPDE
jgi:uncharacterized Zn finger protein